MQKRGLFPQDRGADVVRGTHADATRHARPRGRATRRSGGARWRGHIARATLVHADAREGRHVASEGLTCEGPTG